MLDFETYLCPFTWRYGTADMLRLRSEHDKRILVGYLTSLPRLVWDNAANSLLLRWLPNGEPHFSLNTPSP